MKESKRRGERLTAEEEKDLARLIHKAEAEAKEVIVELDAAQEILGAKPSRAEKTRAGAVDRLEAAVEAGADWSSYKLLKRIAADQREARVG